MKDQPKRSGTGNPLDTSGQLARSGVAQHESEEIFRLLVGAVRDYAIFALDPEGNILTWNAGAKRLKGYEAHEVIGTHFSRFYTPADIARNHPSFELEQAKRKGTYEEEGWRVRKDGSLLWTGVLITALRDPDGTLRGFAKVTRDLTQRKAAEDELRESEERFRLLVSNVQDYAIITLDTQGLVTSWNAGAERIKGYRFSEISGRNFSIFFPKDDVDNGRPAMELRVAELEGRYEDEGWRVRKDGSMFWANITITALRNEAGVLRGFAKVTRDLTARKQADEALKLSQERYRLLIDCVKDYAIILLDAKGRVSSWNQGAKAIKGYEAKEILGFHFSRFYPQEDLDAGKPAMELRAAIEVGRFEDFGWRLRKDGSRFWANVVITPVYSATGDLLGFSKVTRDLTERKAAEEELQRAYDGLELRVQQRTAELAKAKEEAERAVKARDQFLSIASHELKTPLTSLKLQIQLRQRRLIKGGGVPLTAEYFKAMIDDDEKQVRRIGRLVDDMLDIARISTGKFVLELEDVDLSTLVREVTDRIAPQLEAAGAPLTLELAPMAIVHCDRFRIEQVLSNLLINAMKYGDRKPIKISVSIDGDWARFEVRDQGIGIAESDHDRVFGQFERAISAHEVSGLGLGLYIAQQIVGAHGGTISLQSKPGAGAAFTVALPRKGARL